MSTPGSTSGTGPTRATACPYAGGKRPGLLGSDPLSTLPYGEIADRDPLRLDSWMAALPRLNECADTASIVEAIRHGVRAAGDVVEWQPGDAAAALRDLGMLLASLRRHDVEPVAAVPEVEPLVLLLGGVTGMPPRDTVFHYVPWNPVGPRARRFTADPSEDGLVAAVRRSVRQIADAVEWLALAFTAPVQSVQFRSGCVAAGAELTHLAGAMVGLRTDVDPTFFARRLRPYFQQVSLGGCRFSGAAAAPLSVGLVDHLLWSSDCDDDRYREFQTETVQYGLPRCRRLYEDTLGSASMTSRLAGSRGSAAAAQSARAVDAILKVLLTFRGRHLTIARAAYREDRRIFPIGSGGYGTDTLELLLRLTQQARRQVAASTVGGSPCTT